MREWKFDVGGFTLRGKRWGAIGGTPVLALHGWLDNAASFDFLAPKLKGVDLLALDLPGQGKSDHRGDFGAYNIWEDIYEIFGVVEQLGWKKFGLLGHSRGAMISSLIAGAYPERISHLALIESFMPQMIQPHEAPQQLAAAVDALLNLKGKSKSLFDSFDDAVKARENGFLKLCHDDALVLAKRGVTEEHGRYFWANDIKLNLPSEVKFTRAQIEAFVNRIKIPVALVVAENGLVSDFPEMEDLIQNASNVQVSTLPGDHHLHMSQQSEQVAEIFNAYFASK